jgi:hypothetical protein
MVTTPVDLDPRDCNIDLPRVILDGTERDRCPYVGDLAVTGMTLLVSGGDTATLRSMIAWFAAMQNEDGSIPSGAIYAHTHVLVDYNAYWIETLYDYTLYTGDLTLLRDVYPNLVRLVDGLYLEHVDSGGFLASWIQQADYAYINRGGPRVAYYNAQYARALGMAAALARWTADPTRASAWQSRAAALKGPFAAFWDPTVGAFSDTTSDPSVHPLDGNVFAILAGLATPAQTQSILAFVRNQLAKRYGDTIVDSDHWDGGRWGIGGWTRIYPFISYFDLLARFAAGNDDGALGLIRREWGYMLSQGPGTMWETIDIDSGRPVHVDGSLDHGWSSGAAPALTTEVLGVEPTSPGFATFTVTPHPGNLGWARGDVPTPHGTISVSWRLVRGRVVATVTAPAGTRWTNAPAPAPGPAAAAKRTKTTRGKKGQPAARDVVRATSAGLGRAAPR